MKVNYDVKVEEIKSVSNGRTSEEFKMIEQFLKDKRKNMCFEYDTADEAKAKAGVVSGICKRFNKDEKLISYAKRDNKIYIMKAA